MKKLEKNGGEEEEEETDDGDGEEELVEHVLTPQNLTLNPQLAKTKKAGQKVMIPKDKSKLKTKGYLDKFFAESAKNDGDGEGE